MRTKKGIVTSTKMDKTAVVTVSQKKTHSKYKKIFTRSKKFYVDDPKNELQEGQTIVIEETRPLSKLKNWKLVEIVK